MRDDTFDFDCDPIEPAKRCSESELAAWQFDHRYRPPHADRPPSTRITPIADQPPQTVGVELWLQPYIAGTVGIEKDASPRTTRGKENSSQAELKRLLEEAKLGQPRDYCLDRRGRILGLFPASHDDFATPEK